MMAVISGFMIFLIAMAVWTWNCWRTKAALSSGFVMSTALTSLAPAPFLLPKKHDRYFCPADVFSFAAPRFIPAMWFVRFLIRLFPGLPIIMVVDLIRKQLAFLRGTHRPQNSR